MKVDKNIAYFIGVLHSDGCIYFFNDKKRNRTQIRLILQIGTKSIPMALKFQKILFDSFNRTVNLRKLPGRDAYKIQTSINKLWDIFQKWNTSIPEEITTNACLFGAYMAGLIDGDGYVQIKNNIKDRRVPQCVIKISSNEPLVQVRNLIRTHVGCEVYFEPDKRSKCIDTCFYISKKSIDFAREHILPNLAMPYKIQAVKKFILMKTEPRKI